LRPEEAGPAHRVDTGRVVSKFWFVFTKDVLTNPFVRLDSAISGARVSSPRRQPSICPLQA